MRPVKVNLGPITLPVTRAINFYRVMITIRLFEQKAISLYRQGLIRGYFHPYLGEEAIATGVCAALSANDAIVSTHRGHGHCVAKGLDLNKMMAELLGRENGYCRGRGGSMHIADGAQGVLGANGIVGGGIPIAVGAAKGFQIKGTDNVVACFFGDGAANNGILAESLNLAAIWNLPVLFVLENNQYAVSTRADSVSRSENFATRAQAYGLEARTVNGNEVDLVYTIALEGINHCRMGQGPFFMECMTYRHSGHHVNDPGAYMPPEEMNFWKNENDPIVNWHRRMVQSQLASEDELRLIHQEIDAYLNQVIEGAKLGKEPSVQHFMAEMEI